MSYHVTARTLLAPRLWLPVAVVAMVTDRPRLYVTVVVPVRIGRDGVVVEMRDAEIPLLDPTGIASLARAGVVVS